MNTPVKYTATYTVPSSRLDPKCRFSLDGVLSLTQDLAASHYGSGGLSIPHLQRKGLTWVITKQHFEFSEYPLWLDTIEAATWAKPVKGPFCYRDFTMRYAPQGKKASLGAALAQEHSIADQHTPLCAGTSCWMVLSLADNHPVKPDTSIFGTLPFCDDNALPSVFPRIPLCDTWDSELYMEPTSSDIDMNQHVNNLNYVHWVVSGMPVSVMQTSLVKTLDTYFISSAKYGEKLICRLRCLEQESGMYECIHSIIRAADKSEVFRARTVWAPEAALSRELRID